VNLLVVGVSHRSAEVPLLERLTLGPSELPGVLVRLLAQPYLREAVVVSTCNRVEVYAVVASFHGGLADVGAVLAERAGIPVTDLAQQAYAHYGSDAVRHAYRVAAGLDSMVVGESQILGQFREAYAAATEYGATGRLLHELAQQALRVGKRVHAETGIDRAGQSVVSAALALGLAGGDPADTHSKRALVIGAGSMGALALATLHRSGVTDLLVTNRSPARAVHLAAAYGATAVPLAALPDLLSTVDIAVCATASPAYVITEVPTRATPLLLLDLAVPRDVDPAVAADPAVTLVDIERLSSSAAPGDVAATDVAAGEDIVAAEVDAFLAWHRGADVAPTVAALRARAEDVVTAELRRLATRRPDLTDEQRADVAHAVHRVVQRLLHEPTVRVRQRAAEPGGEAYASVLRELFDLPTPPLPPGTPPPVQPPPAQSPIDVAGALSVPPEVGA
jgi:glutamyl-tRNA reductase